MPVFTTSHKRPVVSLRRPWVSEEERERRYDELARVEELKARQLEQQLGLQSLLGRDIPGSCCRSQSCYELLCVWRNLRN